MISPSELASEGEERSVRSSRTPSAGEDAGIARCRCLPDWCSLLVAWPGGAVGVYLLIAEHGGPAIDAVVGGVVAVHGAVESMVDGFGLLDA